MTSPMPEAAAPAIPEDDLADVLAIIAARASDAETDPNGLALELNLLRDAGLLSACLPISQGGAGLGLYAATAGQAFDLLRKIGRANLSVGRLFEGHMNAAKLVQLYGSQRLCDRVAQTVSTGGLLGIWGADGPRPLRFMRDGSWLRLDGEKIFASGLGLVRLAIVTMRETGHELRPSQLALIEVNDRARQAIAGWTATGMRATQSGHYDFSGLEIERSDCLGTPGDYEQEPHFDGGIWRYCAVHLGGAESLMQMWRENLAARKRLADPFQLARFARATGLCRAMENFLRSTACQVENAAGAGPAMINAVVADALLARQFTEDCCVEILALAEKSLGTAAHMAGPVERIRRDLSMFLRQASPDGKLLKAGRLLTANEAVPW